MKLALISISLVVLVSCGGGEDPGGHDHAGGGHAGGESTASFGQAGDPGEADRTIEVSAVDPLKFEPTALQVEQGETITFEVRNEGSTEHEFVLGDAAYQESHGDQMGEMEHEEGNGVFLEQGASDSLTWTFDKPGEVLFACHVNGHFKAGMFGRIEVR